MQLVHTVLTVACTDCKCLPEIATGAKRPRNDKSIAFSILTVAGTNRLRCAGPGCPLPYNARPETFRLPLPYNIRPEMLHFSPEHARIL